MGLIAVVAGTKRQYDDWLLHHIMVPAKSTSYRWVTKPEDLRGLRCESIVFIGTWSRLERAGMLVLEARMQNFAWKTRLVGIRY